MIIRISFDTALARDDLHGAAPVLRPGAREAVLSLARAGHELVLRSPRVGQHEQTREMMALLRAQGLASLFVRVEGETYADVDYSARALQCGDGAPDQTSWDALADSFGDGYVGRVVPPDWPRLVLWRELAPDVVVHLVDGEAVRGNTTFYAIVDQLGQGIGSEKIPYAEGGNPARYPWVPDGEVWIDSGLSADEIGVTALHEIVEWGWMLRGLTYPDAHDKASNAEEECRANPDRLAAWLDRAVDDLHAAQAEGKYKVYD